MPDSRFFEDLGSVGVGELMEITGASLAPGSVAGGATFNLVAPLGLAEADAVGFLSDHRHLEAFGESNRRSEAAPRPRLRNA